MIGLVTSSCCDVPASEATVGYTCDKCDRPCRTYIDEISARYTYVGVDGFLDLRHGQTYDLRFGPAHEVPDQMHDAAVVLTRPHLLAYPSKEVFEQFWTYRDNAADRDAEARGLQLTRKGDAYAQTNASGL